MRVVHFITVMALSVLCSLQSANAEWAISDEVNGMSVQTYISTDQFKRQPKWLKDQENPPVSARQAIRLANSQLKGVEKELRLAKTTLRFKHASIESFGDDYWAWVVEYNEYFNSDLLSGRVRIIVLMDGKAIAPSVKKPEEE